jgi:pimeloyl-ACP methyl ester carboxylesterase
VPYVGRGEARIWYTVQGTGFPVLALAPGGMRSSVPLWEMAAINPLTAYAGQYRMIALDQRNAGQSAGPLETGREIAALAPAGELLEPWKDAEHLREAIEAVGRFLRDHSPACGERDQLPAGNNSRWCW